VNAKTLPYRASGRWIQNWIICALLGDAADTFVIRTYSAFGALPAGRKAELTIAAADGGIQFSA
jgi:hypothetical protein